MIFIEKIAEEFDDYEYTLILSDGMSKLNCRCCTYKGSESLTGNEFGDIFAYGVENIYKSNMHESFVGNHKLSQK